MYVDAEYNALCSGEAQHLTYTKSTDSCKECEDNDGDAEWEEDDEAGLPMTRRVYS